LTLTLTLALTLSGRGCALILAKCYAGQA
jgi:hypothetical protein